MKRRDAPAQSPLQTSDAADDLDFEAAGHADERWRLSVRLEGYEGPLDLMLDMARQQKLDLRAISMLALAEQFLAFIHEAQALRLELAGDYLVMAAWLTYLKSRLILPERANEGEPKAAELAEDLAERLRRLDLVRKLSERLGALLAANADSFPRGAVEVPVIERRPAWEVELNELVAAFAERTSARLASHYRIARRTILSIPEARAALERLIGEKAGWLPLEQLVLALARQPDERRSVTASSFAAALELARDGRMSLRQEAPFAPLLVRRAGMASTGAAP